MKETRDNHVPKNKNRAFHLSTVLLPLSLLYLALPYFFFFAGWLKWHFALPCAALVVAPLLLGLREPGGAIELGPGDLKLRHLLLVFLAALVLLGISGVGGYGYQDRDWAKHNAVFKSLVQRPWPVMHQINSRDSVPLVYYIAFYLPAAYVGKLGGWEMANRALFLWALLGLVLAMLWFVALARRVRRLLLFILFSGLDIVGQLTVAPIIAHIRPDYQLDWGHIEWWSLGWQYSSNVTLLFWVPNQALAGWLVSAIFMETMLHSPQKKYVLFYLGLAGLWSPFVILGVLPFLLADFLTQEDTLPQRLRRYVAWPNLCGMGLLAVIGLFYSAKLYDMPPSLGSGVSHGFVWSFAENTLEKILIPIVIAVFCLLEFGLYAMLIRKSGLAWDRKSRGLFLAAVVCLSLWPFYRLGALNDLVMRVSIPALFFLAVFLARALNTAEGRKRGVLLALIAIGALTTFFEHRRHLTNIQQAGSIVSRPEINEVSDLLSLNPPDSDVDFVAFQYLGSLQAPFFQFLAKSK